MWILISNWEIYEKTSKNSLDREGLLKIAWKLLKFCRKSTGIYRKTRAYQNLMIDFDWAGKPKQPACTTLRVWTKNEENYEKFHKNVEIFWSISLWKIDYHVFY